MAKIDKKKQTKRTTTQLSLKDKKFCECFVINGNNATKAYLEAMDSSVKITTARVQGMLMLDKPKIQAHIEKLHQKYDDMAAINKEEILNFLARAIKTPIGEIDETSDLCTGFTIAPDGQKIYKAYSKKDAVDQTISVCGFSKPQKLAIEGVSINLDLGSPSKK